MGVRKLTTEEFLELRQPINDLSVFWESCFNSVALNYAKILSSYINENVQVKFNGRSIVSFNDLLQLSEGRQSVLTPININPIDDFGIIHLPRDMINLLITNLLGGRVSDNASILKRDFSNFDKKIIESISHDLVYILCREFIGERELTFDIVPDDQSNLVIQRVHEHHLLSAQQFSIYTGRNIFSFELLLPNNLLERFVLL